MRTTQTDKNINGGPQGKEARSHYVWSWIDSAITSLHGMARFLCAGMLLAGTIVVAQTAAPPSQDPIIPPSVNKWPA
jgi:hypothetical protein